MKHANALKREIDLLYDCSIVASRVAIHLGIDMCPIEQGSGF